MSPLTLLRFIISFTLLLPGLAAASDAAALDLTGTGYGIAALAVFFIAYALVIGEELLDMRKSKPVIVAAGIIWVLVGLAYHAQGQPTAAGEALRHTLLEYAELLLFLLSAMTYISVLEERDVFDALRARLISAGLSLRAIFWFSGVLAFFISSIADNLTTALLMSAVTLAIGQGYPRFLVVSCINIVVAANAGGTFCPFGDITTLMVWQKGVVQFQEFFVLFLPALVNWLVPALFMSFAVPDARPAPLTRPVRIKTGGLVVLALFVVTITITVLFYHLLALPPALGMMTGLGLLKLYAYYLKRRQQPGLSAAVETPLDEIQGTQISHAAAFDVYQTLRRVEWDTLLFFYGVLLCVGGLGALGYLSVLSVHMYTALGPTTANILVGIISAVVDNIPVMYAVLNMHPDMSLGQWLLVTFTTGVGGSLLSIGSAAGVAVMGAARGVYTFTAHLRWTWAIALGYAASIATHFWVNGHLM